MNEPTDKGVKVGPKPFRAPRSPWMPFSMLFAAISNKVSEQNMNLVRSNFELFQVCILDTDFSILFHFSFPVFLTCGNLI